MNSKSGWFRDFTRFVVVLLVWEGMISTGYGQDQSAAAIPAAQVAAPVSRLTEASAARFATGKAALTSKTQPLAQVPDFRAVISVSASLSALTTASVTNNTLTITYSVFNLRGDPINGVLLTTTLQSGVTFQSAVPMPDRSGQQIVFSLGSLPPLGSVTATLTVTLANSSVTQIDNGATAYAYWNGISVTSTGMAAALRTTPINTSLLQSTVDANSSDTYIQAQAAALGNNPNAIFAFVRDQIGYESYLGALRGARGTLWSMAGNSLDKASLLIALLHASGIPAQYVSGTLNLALQQRLILSMFPAQTQLTGYVASGATLSNPANDPTLQSEAAAHYWVEFDNGTGTLVDADPDFAGAAIGQTFTAVQSTFAAVPSNLHHTVTVKLNVEITQEGFFGPIQSTSTPLAQSYTSAELVGQPLTLGHLVQSQTVGSIISATTNTYTPYLIASQNNANVGNYPMTTGQQYQEVLANFPFASQILTGVFVEFDVTDPLGNTSTSTHTIVDRIGYAARQGLATATVSLPAGGQPAISPFDNLAINVDSSILAPAVPDLLNQVDQQLLAAGQQLSAGVTQGQAVSPALQQELQTTGTERAQSLARLLAATLSQTSSQQLPSIAGGLVVKAYLDSPRVLLSSFQQTQNGTTVTGTFGLDRPKDNIRSTAFPGQDVQATVAFQLQYGVSEGAVEQYTDSLISSSSAAATLVQSVTVPDVINAALEQKVGSVVLNSENIATLSSLPLSANAQAYITTAISAGKVVVVPTQEVTVGSTTTVGWYEIDPTTGQTTDTMESGAHQAIFEAAATILSAVSTGAAIVLFAFLLNQCLTLPYGSNGAIVLCVVGAFAISGVVLALLLYLAFLLAGSGLILGIGALSGVVGTGVGAGIGGALGGAAQNAANNAGDSCANPPVGSQGGDLYLLGNVNKALGCDPPVSTILTQPNPPAPFTSPTQASAALTEAASLSSGVTQGSGQLVSIEASNQITATWTSSAASSFSVTSLAAAQGTVKDAQNNTIGTGAVALSSAAPVATTISGAPAFSVTGQGLLAFYGPATSALGVSGNWTSYSATISSNPTLQLITGALTLGGSTLPMGTYTIAAPSVTLNGIGATASPNFAGSASMTLTGASVELGQGSGTVTVGGTALDLGNGVALDGFTGSISVIGNGTSDGVTLTGASANALRLSANPSTVTTNQNTPVMVSPVFQTSLSDTYSLTAQAPPGWTVTMSANGNATITPAPGLQAGSYPVYLTAASETDPALIVQCAVVITLAGTQPGVAVTVTVDPNWSVPIGDTLIHAGFRVQAQNLGPAADTFTVALSSPAGFTVENSTTSLQIPAGTTAIDGVYLIPNGALPPAGTVVPLTATVTSMTNPAITGSAQINFTVPALQSVTMLANPASLTTTAGSSVPATLTIQSIGNIPVTVALTSNLSPGLTLSGLPPSVTLAAGQSVAENLTLAVAAGTAPGTVGANLVATWGVNSLQWGTDISVNVTAAQAVAAQNGAVAAQALGRTDIATTLSELSGAINTAISSCSPAAQQSVVDFVNNLIQEMNAPYLSNLVALFQADASAISSATCSTIGTALTQLSTDLASLDTVLQSPAAFPFNFTLVPNSAVATPTQGSQFLIGLQNNSTTTNTYSLSLGSLPMGVSGSLSATSVTLAPGASIPVNNANNNPTVTVTPTTGTAFQFSLNASINGVAGSTQTAYGTITARSTFLAVQDVTATPGFTQSGGSVDVVTHIANVVNQNKSVQVVLVVNNSSNTMVLGPFTQTVALSVTSLLTTVDFGQIATTGLANGNYTLAVSVIDPVTNMVMPGGTGTGSLLIGSPVSATLTVSPTTLAPGNATVTSTLAVTSTNGQSGPAPFSLIGSVATASAAESVAINGNTAYTCDSNEVTVINATNPTNPTVAGTALAGAINNARDIFCDIQRGDLVMLADTGNSGIGNTPSFLAFDLTNPLSPNLIASTLVDKRFFGAPFYQGNTAFFATLALFLSGSTITGQAGDFVSLDVTNFSAPAVLGTIEEPETEGPVYGGSFNVYGATPYNTTLAYATATTSQGATPQTGTGQLWAVNTSNPSAMSIVSQTNVPGTIQLVSPLVQGNTAVAIGDTGGWRNPDVSVDAYTGNVVVAVFDLTNPQSPQLIANVSTAYVPAESFGSGAVVIGPQLFLYGGVMNASNNQLLMLVDTTTPQNPVITTYVVPAAINVMKAVGTLLYAPTASGLQIYSIPGTGSISYTASVQVPNTGKVIYNPSSFSTAPTITPGTGFDTLTFTNPASNTITWTSNVTGISPADVLPVALGGTVNFTVTAGSGSITLPQVNINSGQIVGLNPGTQTVAPGQLASYTLIVNNPTSAAVTYNLAATGVNPSWVTLQPSVTVPANGSTNVPLTLRSTLADLAGTYNFMVTATSGGASGAVEGTMLLVGTGSIGSLGSTNALGASVLLTPTQQTGGQGTPATFTVQVTNAGNVADTYTLSATTPGGVTATFSQPTLTIQPGLGNFQQTLLQLTAAPGTPPGPLNFTVTATSQTNSQIANTASGILNVISTGVAVSLSPPSVSPGGMFQLTVRNTGQTAGTFAIALGGPASVIATLASSSVTLAAGQSQNISVAIGSAPFAALGSLGLVATASANGVTGAATGTVVIPSSQNVSAAFNPARTALSAPGPATLLLQVQNAGTTQDTYTATIVSTTGPVAQASIVDITGQNVQTTSPFILPGVTLGELAVNATLTANNASGTVTVKIVSQTNPSITALATGILGIGADMPVAIAGKNRNVLTGKYTSLDGGQSFDPGKATLTYAWTIVSKPAASVLTTLVNASTPQPDLLPDVNGAYTLQLIVNNGTQSSAPSLVTITAYTTGVPPNANAGAAANALRGSPVTLNGSLSNDPSGNNQALSYQWTIQSAPAGSALTGATLASTAMPSFTPDADGAFLVALTVTDSFGSSTDTVTITAYDPSVPPNAVAGANRRILIATPVTVNGSGSNDPGSSSAVSYQWSFVSSTLPSSSLQNANTPSVTFTPPMAGFYVARLDVSNGTANSFGEATVMAASYCDANADGVVNQLDFDLMTALSGTTAQANDPLDVNGDGLVTAADVTLCQAKTGIVGGTVQLSLAPANLSFSYTIGGALPAAQGFGASSSSSSPLSTLLWSPNAPWIQLSPTSGQTPFNALASVNPTGLAPGGYQGLIYAAASGAGNVPQIVVTLEVYATPQFILTPASLNFSYQTGQAPPAPQTLEVASSGKVVPYTSSVSASWLSIQPSSGQTPYPSSVSVSPQNLAPGTYTGTITFTSPQAASASVAVTLVVTPAPPVISASNIVNAASLLSGPIAPGEMLNISGTGFAAPGAAILAPSGQALPMELGSTQVFFNNTPAPMSSVQANQVSVVVPYEVQGQSTVLLKVVYSGAASQTVNLIVTATAPGIFTSNSSGVGEITAVNVDGTLNSSGNPAARGTPITFYATGGGQTTPAGVDGALAGKTPPVPVAPVTLMIGGVEAQVTYAGGAPGYPAGLMQINAVIPPGIAPNVSTPVILTIGTAQSQPATTIATH